LYAGSEMTVPALSGGNERSFPYDVGRSLEGRLLINHVYSRIVLSGPSFQKVICGTKLFALFLRRVESFVRFSGPLGRFREPPPGFGSANRGSAGLASPRQRATLRYTECAQVQGRLHPLSAERGVRSAVLSGPRRQPGVDRSFPPSLPPSLHDSSKQMGGKGEGFIVRRSLSCVSLCRKRMQGKKNAKSFAKCTTRSELCPENAISAGVAFCERFCGTD